MADTPTIYEWAGGREAFARWLDAFYDLARAMTCSRRCSAGR
jgi:truncated hemoglobin YjbI